MVLVSIFWKSKGKCTVLEILEKWTETSSATVRGSETTSSLTESEGGVVYLPDSF